MHHSGWAAHAWAGTAWHAVAWRSRSQVCGPCMRMCCPHALWCPAQASDSSLVLRCRPCDARSVVCRRSADACSMHGAAQHQSLMHCSRCSWFLSMPASLTVDPPRARAAYPALLCSDSILAHLCFNLFQLVLQRVALALVQSCLCSPAVQSCTKCRHCKQKTPNVYHMHALNDSGHHDIVSTRQQVAGAAIGLCTAYATTTVLYVLQAPDGILAFCVPAACNMSSCYGTTKHTQTVTLACLTMHETDASDSQRARVSSMSESPPRSLAIQDDRA